MKLDINKKYSLALGGGAARGLVHVGVITYLEENNICIQEVSGTSMGAIVAALYAFGKSSNEMIQIATDIKIVSLIDMDLKQGLLKGKKVCAFLEGIFGETQIEDLEIPLQIVATCLETGEPKVFTSGRIVDAIRASISIPGAFMPHKIGEYSYMDGLATMNLPIEVLDSSNVIAVSALKNITGSLSVSRNIFGFNIDKTFMSVGYDIMQRTMLIMMRQNENRSIATPGKNIHLIQPDFGDLDYYSFNKVSEMIELGYTEASNNL